MAFTRYPGRNPRDPAQRLLLTGGTGAPTIWYEAVLQVFRRDDPRIAAPAPADG
jgi:hypothetical protein